MQSEGEGVMFESRVIGKTLSRHVNMEMALDFDMGAPSISFSMGPHLVQTLRS